MNNLLNIEEYNKVMVDNVEAAHTLPSQAYTSKAFFDAEAEYLLKTEWFPVCHEQMLPNVGDFFTLNVFHEKIVAIRGEDENIYVLDRCCINDGKDLFISPFTQGHCGDSLGNVLRHRSWVYNLQGQLTMAPGLGDQIDVSSKSLKQYKLEVWKGFVFVNIDGKADGFAKHAGVLESWLKNYNLDSLIRLPELTIFEMDANWKLVAENYIEAYHHMAIHKETFEKVAPGRNTTVNDLADKTIVLDMPIELDFAEALDWGLPPIATLQEEDLSTFPVWLVMPFFLITSLHNSIAWLQLVPLSENKSMWIAHFFFPEASFSEPEKIKETLHGGVEIHNEDMDACIGNHKGMLSRHFEQGRLHPLEKGVWYFDRYILDTLSKRAPNLFGLS